MNRDFLIIRRLPINRKTIYLSLLCCLLIPLFIVSRYGTGFITLFSISSASISGWLLLRIWEKKMQHSVTQILHSKMEKIQEPQPSVPDNDVFYKQEIQRLVSELEKAQIGYEHQINLMQSSVAKSKNEVHQLNLEMDKKLEEVRVAYLEFEDLRKEYNRLEEEAVRQNEETQKNLKHKDSLLTEYQRTISEQRMIIEKKQRYIAKLEGKVRDLMYEIRSLLQLETTPPKGDEREGLGSSEQAMIDAFLLPSSSPQTPYDFSMQLQKYIEKVENLTGVDHLGYVGGKSPRFLDLSLECYAIDRRRLFDIFKDETAGIMYIYSPSERKFLFVNQLVKSLIGWSPEKFMKEFSRLVPQGYLDWEEAVSKVKAIKECSMRLAILNKSGQLQSFECYMGMISKGPFIQHVIGMFIPIGSVSGFF